MKRNEAVLLLVLLVYSSIGVVSCPALATELANSDAALHTNEITSKSDGAVPPNSQPPRVKKSPMPKKIFSIATAFCIGTPVCIIRRSKYEEWYGVHGMLGDSESKSKKILAGTFWLPFAIICGTAEAPFDALANGVMYPAFSKDQLSQGKLVQNN